MDEARRQAQGQAEVAPLAAAPSAADNLHHLSRTLLLVPLTTTMQNETLYSGREGSDSLQDSLDIALECNGLLARGPKVAAPADFRAFRHPL